MGIFDFLMGPDINQGVQEYHAAPGAVLLDVRTPEEYRQGHIPGSKNVPLYVMDQVKEVADLDTPLFVYCHSGARSREAVSMLERMGYSKAKNIGGITAYKGEVER
jgi:phage shock protein E